MKLILLTITLCSLFVAGAYQLNQAQIEFNNSFKAIETAQVEQQKIINDLPESGSCYWLQTCTPGSCDSINACPKKDNLLEAMSINPFNYQSHYNPKQS